jgi:hypothetical protein
MSHKVVAGVVAVIAVLALVGGIQNAVGGSASQQNNSPAGGAPAPTPLKTNSPVGGQPAPTPLPVNTAAPVVTNPPKTFAALTALGNASQARFQTISTVPIGTIGCSGTRVGDRRSSA